MWNSFAAVLCRALLLTIVEFTSSSLSSCSCRLIHILSCPPFSYCSVFLAQQSCPMWHLESCPVYFVTMNRAKYSNLGGAEVVYAHSMKTKTTWNTAFVELMMLNTEFRTFHKHTRNLDDIIDNSFSMVSVVVCIYIFAFCADVLIISFSIRCSVSIVHNPASWLISPHGIWTSWLVVKHYGVISFNVICIFVCSNNTIYI